MQGSEDCHAGVLVPDDKVCDLQSDYYGWGMMGKTDQKYLQTYVTQRFALLSITESAEKIIEAYRDLVALADYVACCTKAAGNVQ
ncbi:MAG: hypothetical protein HFH49_12800 [Lachnospiraceae bacterium]|nr:hypothetical protein [Lachnospiraceae bacterium]